MAEQKEKEEILFCLRLYVVTLNRLLDCVYDYADDISPGQDTACVAVGRVTKRDRIDTINETARRVRDQILDMCDIAHLTKKEKEVVLLRYTSPKSVKMLTADGNEKTVEYDLHPWRHIAWMVDMSYQDVRDAHEAALEKFVAAHAKEKIWKN